ncbi:MAG: hypothetical protein EP332_08245 [Bacteroidetes bacterium]|nr:MAG: hypothetical protein EP332_08245 [Bacteroidota bacterium]
MKKFVAIVVLFLYSISSFGMMVQLNYCDGEFSSIEVLDAGLESMDCCKVKSDDEPCCSTLIIQIEAADEDQQASSTFKEIKRPQSYSVALPVIAHVGAPNTQYEAVQSLAPMTESPGQPRIHVLHCCFRN